MVYVFGCHDHVLYAIERGYDGRGIEVTMHSGNKTVDLERVPFEQGMPRFVTKQRRTRA